MIADGDAGEITWPYKHVLKRSVEVPGGTLAEIELREPTTADFLEFGLLDGADGETMFRLIVKLSGKPEPVLKAMPGIEAMILVKKLSAFFVAAAR